MRPRRQVIESDRGWAVTDSNFVSTDRTLAEVTRDELDRIDPLPCPHDEEMIEIRQLGQVYPRYICQGCGERFEHDDPVLADREK